ncbi:predicted protein [Aspergillus nidulans FGSC A4]|uniref:Uncharacterized protein n=1 Tax=Emericella nidulans (strain FGSC A4 / ATCC 38163 / CBS 112.46 / NRRL 194 / M139) TaxID=227321 RepID=Q5B2G6_EMENI|nr:hypothetical protein [Aspergillus nidulans FGSC A4]EAA62214.1 predicted protein [Aspergillus nidulans FGSC A4]CBF82218.1 TPA: conserved hypothetical protein [Aspergillus nidulans FGSC A4]|eukprot:XP_662868.1 predicted protein [Aspergillus nidulans FGSC A4]
MHIVIIGPKLPFSKRAMHALINSQHAKQFSKDITRWGVIQGHTAVDLEVLEDLFNKEILPATEECGVFEPLSSRRKYCDLCPYMLFTSHGIYKHPPPLPSKAPERILAGVKRIIEQIRDPNLTTAIIQKQHLISYPNGQDINSLIFLQNTDQNLKDYIQEYYHDSQGTMSKDINEVLFATFLPDQCKIITLLRVFTSIDSTEGYYLLFKRVFSLVQRISHQPIYFDPIHGSGIHGIIIDMDSKQYTKYENANVQNWASQKKGAVIKAGLNKACSKIQPYYFDLLQNYTNAVEQSHQKSYISGKYLSLVQAVKNSAKLDRDDILQYDNFQEFNIHHSYQTSNMEANYLRHMSRERSQKRRRSALSPSTEAESASPLPQGNTRSRSQNSSRIGDDESIRSGNLRRAISTNALNLEQRRQELELENFELELQQKRADLKKKEEDIHLQQLQNEKLELDLMERRICIQEAQQHELSSL